MICDSSSAVAVVGVVVVVGNALRERSVFESRWKCQKVHLRWSCFPRSLLLSASQKIGRYELRNI